MTDDKRLRLNLNTRALTRTASLISNTIVLTANAFLIGTGITSSLRNRKRERTIETLEMGAQVANAAAGLTKVIVSILENGKTDQDV